jgi:hypothetical protein
VWSGQIYALRAVFVTLGARLKTTCVSIPARLERLSFSFFSVDVEGTPEMGDLTHTRIFVKEF